jgi:hypothetical protein
LPEKPATRGKIKPLGFKKVGHESEHLGVTWLKHIVVPLKWGNNDLNMCYYIKENRTIILLEMSDNRKNDYYPTPQECGGSTLNHKREAKFAQRSNKSGLTINWVTERTIKRSHTK